LQSIRDIHAIKAWNDVAVKNFYKALDLKGFEFKKNEKERMKNQYFLAELN
jgi:histone deacetylase complex regulatory component SIN3